MNVEAFLETVSRQLAAVQQARELYAPKLSPDFNCLQYIAPNEMRLSQIIADLLDWEGKHSQRDKFLSAFLNKCGSLNNCKLELRRGIKAIHVKKEVFTRNIERDKRRIDIEVQWPEFTLAIENKPWARDQNNQLLDYITDLELIHK